MWRICGISAGFLGAIARAGAAPAARNFGFWPGYRSCHLAWLGWILRENCLLSGGYLGASCPVWGDKGLLHMNGSYTRIIQQKLNGLMSQFVQNSTPQLPPRCTFFSTARDYKIFLRTQAEIVAEAKRTNTHHTLSAAENSWVRRGRKKTSKVKEQTKEFRIFWLHHKSSTLVRRGGRIFAIFSHTHPQHRHIFTQNLFTVSLGTFSRYFQQFSNCIYLPKLSFFTDVFSSLLAIFILHKKNYISAAWRELFELFYPRLLRWVGIKCVFFVKFAFRGFLLVLSQGFRPGQMNIDSAVSQIRNVSITRRSLHLYNALSFHVIAV